MSSDEALAALERAFDRRGLGFPADGERLPFPPLSLDFRVYEATITTGGPAVLAHVVFEAVATGESGLMRNAEWAVGDQALAAWIATWPREPELPRAFSKRQFILFEPVAADQLQSGESLERRLARTLDSQARPGWWRRLWHRAKAVR